MDALLSDAIVEGKATGKLQLADVDNLPKRPRAPPATAASSPGRPQTRKKFLATHGSATPSRTPSRRKAAVEAVKAMDRFLHDGTPTSTDDEDGGFASPVPVAGAGAGRSGVGVGVAVAVASAAPTRAPALGPGPGPGRGRVAHAVPYTHPHQRHLQHHLQQLPHSHPLMPALPPSGQPAMLAWTPVPSSSWPASMHTPVTELPPCSSVSGAAPAPAPAPRLMLPRPPAALSVPVPVPVAAPSLMPSAPSFGADDNGLDFDMDEPLPSPGYLMGAFVGVPEDRWAENPDAVPRTPSACVGSLYVTAPVNAPKAPAAQLPPPRAPTKSSTPATRTSTFGLRGG